MAAVHSDKLPEKAAAVRSGKIMVRRKFPGAVKGFLCGCIGAVFIAASGCTAVSDDIPGEELLSDGEMFTDTFTYGGDLTETGNVQNMQTMPAMPITPITAETTAAQGTELSDIIKREAVPAGGEVETTGDITGSKALPEGDVTAVSDVGGITETAASESVSETFPETVTQAVPETSRQEITIVTLPKRRTETETEAADVKSGEVQDTEGGYYPTNGYYPLNFKEQRAVWFSYLEYDRLMRGKSREEFASGLGDCFDNAAALGINTVYFQVRAYGDAYYRSRLFPGADRLTGDYDPLEIAVKEAHDRGLSIHAWVNPMRLMTDAQMAGVSEEYPIGKWYASQSARGTVIVNHSGRWYLSPAYSEAVDLICDGISEIVTGYNVDGVQIDDYFYPTADEAFDKAAYEASGSPLPIADWRRETVTNMVKRIYSTVHSANPKAVFGISPSGNVASDRDEMYADVERWLGEAGCCDYICPQIYYGFENEAMPFAAVCDVWAGLIKRDDIKLVIGLAAYKSGLEDKYAGKGRYEWQEHSDILARQQQTASAYSAGVAFFRYDSLFLPDPAVAVNVTAEMETLRSVNS